MQNLKEKYFIAELGQRGSFSPADSYLELLLKPIYFSSQGVNNIFAMFKHEIL